MELMECFEPFFKRTCHWCNHTGKDVSVYPDRYDGEYPCCDNVPECTKRMIENAKNKAINEIEEKT